MKAAAKKEAKPTNKQASKQAFSMGQITVQVSRMLLQKNAFLSKKKLCKPILSWLSFEQTTLWSHRLFLNCGYSPQIHCALFLSHATGKMCTISKINMGSTTSNDSSRILGLTTYNNKNKEQQQKQLHHQSCITNKNIYRWHFRLEFERSNVQSCRRTLRVVACLTCFELPQLRVGLSFCVQLSPDNYVTPHLQISNSHAQSFFREHMRLHVQCICDSLKQSECSACIL